MIYQFMSKKSGYSDIFLKHVGKLQFVRHLGLMLKISENLNIGNS